MSSSKRVGSRKGNENKSQRKFLGSFSVIQAYNLRKGRVEPASKKEDRKVEETSPEKALPAAAVWNRRGKKKKKSKKRKEASKKSAGSTQTPGPAFSKIQQKARRGRDPEKRKERKTATKTPRNLSRNGKNHQIARKQNAPWKKKGRGGGINALKY